MMEGSGNGGRSSRETPKVENALKHVERTKRICPKTDKGSAI